MDLICATAHLHFCFRNLFKDMSMFDDDMIPVHSLSGFDSSMALKEGGSDARALVGHVTVLKSLPITRGSELQPL